MRGTVNRVSETERQFWLWVTRPDYYLNEDGNDREDLDPSSGIDSDGWWTCHKDTRQGDLILLWRTSPKCDIGYLLQAASDSYSIANDDFASEHGWDYGCDYVVLFKFDNPVTISEIRESVYLDDWNALTGNFQRKVFRTSPTHWELLCRLIIQKNSKFKTFLNKTLKTKIDRKIMLEEELENELVDDLSILAHHGYNLKLYRDPDTGISGRQYICIGLGGRIDLLCRDIKSKQFVIIELKNVRAGQNTFGQISSYVGWVKKSIAGSASVKGLVISRGFDTKFESAMTNSSNIKQIDLSTLGFS